MVIVFIVITSRRVWGRWAEVDLCYGVGYHLIVFVINSKFSSDCNVTSLDQSNLLVIDNNSFDYISSEPSLLDCQIVLDDVFKPDYTWKNKMLNGSLDKTDSAPSQWEIEVGYLDCIF